MGAKSKSKQGGSAARKRVAKPTGTRGRKVATGPEAWEQAAQIPDERDDEIDCERIVEGDVSRGVPAYYNEYN